jgi:hypothetical protein
MEIRASQVRELFRSRYPWAGEIEVKDHTDWRESINDYEACAGPHWYVEVNDEGVWRHFKLKISVEEV